MEETQRKAPSERSGELRDVEEADTAAGLAITPKVDMAPIHQLRRRPTCAVTIMFCT